ncbi:MAG TPA: histidine kinase [Chitinophagaceae bacterium]
MVNKQLNYVLRILSFISENPPLTTHTYFIDSYGLFVYGEGCYIDWRANSQRFADIYLFKFIMKKLFEIKRFIFYLWLGLPFLFLWVWHDISTFDATFLQALLNNFWRTVYIVVVNFVFFEYVVSFVLRKRRSVVFNILLSIMLLFVFMIIWSYGLYAWRSLGVALHIYTPLGLPANLETLLESQMAFSAGSIFFFGIIRHIYNYIKLKQAEQKLRIEKQAAELNYLKSQTNPHFLFNTLNNIYSLARDKSDLAPESILRLSKILRFMLYEAGGDYISIGQELKIISDYIDLEKLRYDESLRINFNHNIEDMKQALPPLLLIPLVENAFKHGVSETRNRPFVDIHLSVNQRQLSFVVKNSAEVIPGETVVKENIGLANLRRQLELLYTDFNLSVQEGDSVFTATLKINLASHV